MIRFRTAHGQKLIFFAVLKLDGRGRVSELACTADPLGARSWARNTGLKMYGD